MSRARDALLTIILAVTAVPFADAASASSLVEKAKAAVERGDVEPGRDLAPLVAALRTARGGGLDTLIDGIEELGAYDGPSPAGVKAYLQQEAPPALIEVARGKADWTIRGDALMALRSLNASDEHLDRAAAVAAADTTKEAGYIRSRGELLLDWKRSRPQPAAGTTEPTDPARERKALAFLKARGLRVSVDQLQASAREGNADEVEALLDAGLSPNAGGRVGSALDMAAGLGCAMSEGDLEGRLATLRVLIRRGADVKAKDPLDNTVLLTSAQHCPLPVVRLLVEAGAPVDAVNRQGVSPLSMAFIGNRWDVVEYLVDKGARVRKADVDSVFFEMPTDPRKVALIRRATGK
ncbi:MAG TPA: ankyrin repeat domain-containing protein [Vicinamibacteria bacterium]|nr:ankyrin repeat domain-containing protein [Vicinamibacteria bacterium]